MAAPWCAVAGTEPSIAAATAPAAGYPGIGAVAAAAGAASASAPVVARSLRNTLRGLSDWGASIERRHFDGNFLEAVSQAPRKVGECAGRLGEELGSAAVRLVEEAQGKGVEGTPAVTFGLGPTPGSRREDAPAAPGACGAGAGLPLLGSAPSLWEERERLQAELSKERDMRRGRASALAALDEAMRAIRAELVEERQQLSDAEDARMMGCGRADAAERALEELQEEHHVLQGHKATWEAELRRYAVAVAAKERAERQASREGAWAREGPETEALKAAKLELAEILGAADEARLVARREAAQLTRELEATRAEGERLRQRVEQNASPQSLRASVRRLLAVARGRDGEETVQGQASVA